MTWIEEMLKPSGPTIVASEYVLIDREHHEFFSKRTISVDLANKLEVIKLVEHFALRITNERLDSIPEHCSEAQT